MPLKDLPGDETSACFVTNSLNIYWSVRNIPSVILSEVFWYKIYTTKLYLTTVHELQFIDNFSNLAMLACWGTKKVTKRVFSKKTKQNKNNNNNNNKTQPVLTKIATTSLGAWDQRGAADWKTLKKLKFTVRQILTNSSNVTFSENWLQILKIVQGVKSCGLLGKILQIKFSPNFRLQNGLNLLNMVWPIIARIRKDAWFGLGLTLCANLKILNQLSVMLFF